MNNIDPVSKSLRNINELRSPITPTAVKDNSQTCPKVIEKKFFSSNEEIDIPKPEIKILQTEKQETPDTVNSLKNTNFLQTPLETKDKPKPMLRTQRKSLSGLFPQSLIGTNSALKKIATGVLKSPTPNNNFHELAETNRNNNEVEIIQRNKTINEINDMPPSQFYSTRSLFGKSRKTVVGIRKNTKVSHEDLAENPYKEDEFMKTNKFLQGIRKIDESEIPFSKMGSSNNLLASGRLIMGKNSMSEIILTKDQMNLAKNLNMKKNNVSISDRDHLASPPNNTPNGRRNSNRIRMSIKKGEFKNLMDKSASSNEDSKKHLYNIAEIEIAAVKNLSD